MKTTLAIQLALSLAFAGTAAVAHAQYIWLDEHGVKQFSDQPPPSNVPQKRILKEPSRATSSMSESDADGGNSDNAENAPKTVADQNADYVKRQIAKAEKDKKAAQQAELDALKAKNCARAQKYAQALSSGERISSTDENGERSYMSDEQRAQELSDNQRITQNCE